MRLLRSVLLENWLLRNAPSSAREFVSIVMDGLAGEVNETQLSYLRIAKESCTQLAVYINDLLDATRLDAGKLHMELKPVSLLAGRAQGQNEQQ